MGETREHRIKRMKMRSMRRGIKEMDLILSAYAETRLDGLSEPELDLYDSLLEVPDQELFQWVLGRVQAPDRFAGLVAELAQVLQK